MRRAAGILLLLSFGPVSAQAATPIPNDPLTTPPTAFEGAPAIPRAIDSRLPPRHPHMAPNGKSNIHVDAYQTDANAGPGPLGRGTTVTSTLKVADCASVTFDSRGRIVSVCVGIQGPRLEVMDPVTLDRLGGLSLPLRDFTGGLNILSDFSGGGYFYLDHRDRAVIPTTTRHIWVAGVQASGGVALERDYDLTAVVPRGDKLYSALPDWSGRLWFITGKGITGTIDPTSRTVRTLDLREDIANSFAVDDTGGVFVVTKAALYRLAAGPGGTPRVTWRARYRNSGIAKPGQVHAGSGTTPTVMSAGYVAITDNADPMNVVVYRKATGALVCEQPVFRRGASATDNSLIAAGNSLVVENNYGYSGLSATMNGRTTKPGIERVDVLPKGRGCRTVWRSDEVSPTVVPKLSLATGLVYAYTKPARVDEVDAWYLTALDFCTGRRVWRRLGGTGFGFNNNYAPVTLGADGSAYVGVLGGLVRFADSTPPAGAPPGARRGCAPRPRLALRVRRARRTCGVVARVAGADRALVRRVAFRVGARGRRVRDGRPPFRRVLSAGTRRVTVRAFVRLRDGGTVRLRARARRCGSSHP